MDRLSELLGTEVDIATLSSEELEARKIDLTDAAKAAREGELTAEVAELIKTAATQVGQIRAEEGARAEAAAQIIADADEAIALLGDDDTETEEGDETETGEAETPAEEAAPETPAEAAPEAEVAVPLAAAATPAKTPVRRDVKVPARARPRTPARGGAAIVASGEVKGVQAGHAFASLDEMHNAMYDKWDSMRHTGDGLQHHVASFDWRGMYDDAHTIRGGDPYEVATQLARVTEEHIERMRGERAMVASGGVPGPSEPNYNVLTFGQANRPLRDGLPSVMMKRGATVYNISPVLGAVTLDTGAGAIGTVTSASDVSAPTKDIQEVPAPTAKTSTVEAETMRWSQGNFADRFLPEWTAAFIKLGHVAYARHNDGLRLADIKTGCTKYTDTPAKFGAYRDLKRAFIGQAEELEDLVREFDVPIRVLMPEYVPAILATDLIAQAPGDEAYRITEEAVRADMQSWDPNITITWLADSIRGRLSTTPSGQSPRSAGFDADVEWAMFPEGAFVFGDGGQLDLGILRDSNTVATNKFQTFFEAWECILQPVDPTLCFWITNSLCANGASQLPSAVNVCSPQGS